MTIGALGSMVGATLIGPVKNNFSWEITFLSFIGMILVAGFIMQLLQVDKHAERLTGLQPEETVKQPLVTTSLNY